MEGAGPHLAPATQRLWLTDPLRATCIATVVAVRGEAFALDRGLFAPTSRRHRHPQPADLGTIWWDGAKRRLARVFERDGSLWHVIRGARPDIGTRLNCHIDPERRMEAARGHTAMHLVLKALWDGGGPTLVDDPVVKGGSTVRLELDATAWRNEAAMARQVNAAVAQANRWVSANLGIRRGFVARGEETHLLDAQRFAAPDPYPGMADTVPTAAVEGLCTYPCDGTHVVRTQQIGRIETQSIRLRRASGSGAAGTTRTTGTTGTVATLVLRCVKP